MYAVCSGKYPRQEIKDICLSVCGEHVWIRGLVDTGNRLYDGKKQRPVCVMDPGVIEGWLPGLKEKLNRYLKKGERDPGLGFHYLPYCSLGRSDGLALVFTAEYLMVPKNRRKRRTLHPRIAVADSNLLTGRGYQIILHPDVL